jgi:signal transduction histidine kinase
VLVALLISSLNAERRQLERALREQDRRKDEFLAVLAHELRTPLSAIVHAQQVGRMPSVDGTAIARAWDIVERQAGQLARILNDLLDVSRINQGKVRLCKERVNLAEVVAQAFETTHSLITARRHRLELSLPPGQVILEADPTRLEQIIVNLLTNAAKYTKPAGHILVAIERAGDDVLVRVRDTGIGLSQEVLPGGDETRWFKNIQVDGRFGRAARATSLGV